MERIGLEERSRVRRREEWRGGDERIGVEGSGVEWNGVEWSGAQQSGVSGVERVE